MLCSAKQGDKTNLFFLLNWSLWLGVQSPLSFDMLCTCESVCGCGYESVLIRGKVSKHMFLHFNEKTLHLMYRNNVLFILLTTGQLDNG